jgi:acetoin utilization deacetylase AcuC-like enzyme
MQPKIIYYYPAGHQKHFETGHPERPERVEVIKRTLQGAGLWDQYPKVVPGILDEQAMNLVHHPTYLTLLQSKSKYGQHLDQDTYTTSQSWEIATNTAAGGVAVTRAVWNAPPEEQLVGFALTRPPGHHATYRRGMGFCLINNIAVAAQHLISAPDQSTRKAQRLAIIDVDLHHGNGTQDIFWERDDVLFMSVHQSPLYPGSGGLDEVGSGVGTGYSVNLPMPPGTGDEGYAAAVDQIFLPILDRFQPEMLLISYGFDTHWMDPLGHMQISTTGLAVLFGKLTEWARKNCSGKLAIFLEGGYDLDAAAYCSLGIVATLLQVPWQDKLGASNRPEGKSWRPVIERAKQIWKI